tara:strand:- start:68 stop:871 length:804 start_codon:yes stop_codon:yes gene_type:complete
MVSICWENLQDRGYKKMGEEKWASNADSFESKTVREEYERILGVLNVEITPPPCETHNCRYKPRCKNELLACKSFLNFLTTGNNLASPSLPTRQIYRKGFYESPYNGSNRTTPDNLSLVKFGDIAKKISEFNYDINSEEAELQGKEFFNLYKPLEDAGVKNPLLYLAKEKNWEIGFVYKGVKRWLTITYNADKRKLDKLIEQLKEKSVNLFSGNALAYNSRQQGEARMRKKILQVEYRKTSSKLLSQFKKGRTLLEKEEKRKAKGNY